MCETILIVSYLLFFMQFSLNAFGILLEMTSSIFGPIYIMQF